MVKIWSEWNVARLVLPVSAIVVLFWTAGLWTDLECNNMASTNVCRLDSRSSVNLFTAIGLICM